MSLQSTRAISITRSLPGICSARSTTASTTISSKCSLARHKIRTQGQRQRDLCHKLYCPEESGSGSQRVGAEQVAAKRRKNAAHGASRGRKWEIIQPQRGERKVLTHTRRGERNGYGTDSNGDRPKKASPAERTLIYRISLIYKYLRSKVLIPQRLGGNKPFKSLILKDRGKGV